MKFRLIPKNWVLQLLCLLICVSCASDPTTSKSSADNLVIGAVVGALIGSAIGAASDGESGKGAVVGATAGAVMGVAAILVIDQYNKKKIQAALKRDRPTTFTDTRTNHKISIVPERKYFNDHHLRCITFQVINLNLNRSNKSNRACLIKGIYEFVVTDNNTIVEPVVSHYAPFPVPDPNPPPPVGRGG